MIKAALFDYGGVMSASKGEQGFTSRLGEVLDMSSAEAYDYLKPYWRPLLTGEVSEDEVWSGLEQATGKQIALGDRNIWNTWEQMQPLPEMVQLVGDLQQRSIPVGLVSNTFSSAKAPIRSHGGYDIFDFVVLSDEVGCAKPDIEIYRHALRELGTIAAEAVVFVDDQIKCLEPAKALGMSTILAVDPPQVIEAISRLLR
jgi:HAD superfamily hydrolase (TIGR01509 family)